MDGQIYTTIHGHPLHEITNLPSPYISRSFFPPTLPTNCACALIAILDTSVATFFSGKGSETLTIASGSGTPLLREQAARNCLGRYSCRYFFTVSLYIFFSLQLLVDIIMDFFGFVELATFRAYPSFYEPYPSSQYG